MTTEKKAVSKASPSKTSKTAVVKPEAAAKRLPATRRTAAKKASIKRPVSTATPRKTKEKTAVTPTVKVVSAKPVKAVKLGKIKMERDSFTMPKDEYAKIAELKARLLALGQPAKKSELLRAGVKLLAAMTDARLKTTMASIPVIKTGRPKKKK